MLTRLVICWLVAIALFWIVGRWIPGGAPERAGRGEHELVLLCPYGSILERARGVAKLFEEQQPGWTVRIVPAPGRDYYMKALTLLAARAEVDLLWLGLGFGMFADRGALLPLDEMVKSDASFSRNDFSPQALEMYQLGGRLYGLPYALDFQAYAINESLLKMAGMAPPDADWTLEEFLAIGRKTTRRESGGRVYGLGMTEVSPLLYGMGMLTPDGRRFGLSGERGVDLMRLNIELADEGVLLRSAHTGQLDNLNEFLSGRVAIMSVYTWDLLELQKRAGFDWRLLPPPLYRDGSQKAWASSQGFSISARTEKAQMAWKLLVLLTSEEVQRAMPRDVVPTRKLVLAEYEAALSEREKPLLGSLSRLAPDPRIRQWEKVYSEWQYWQEQAFEKQCTPEAALQIAGERINRILEDKR